VRYSGASTWRARLARTCGSLLRRAVPPREAPNNKAVSITCARPSTIRSIHDQNEALVPPNLNLSPSLKTRLPHTPGRATRDRRPRSGSSPRRARSPARRRHTRPRPAARAGATWFAYAGQAGARLVRLLPGHRAVQVSRFGRSRRLDVPPPPVGHAQTRACCFANDSPSLAALD
jgi:hypothetical protein